LRTTAPPRRPEVTNPARHGPEFSTGITFNIRNLPRCVIPSRFTRSYSERCVRRRVFGKENEPAGAILIVNPLSHAARSQDLGLRKHFASGRPRTSDFSTKKVFHRNPAEDFLRKRIPAIYCPGDSAGASAVSAGVSAVPAGESIVAAAGTSAAGGLVISVVAGGGVVGVGLVAGVTVSVFCSHATRSAALARMQMYFFIVGDAHCFNRSIAARAVFWTAHNVATQMARHEH